MQIASLFSAVPAMVNQGLNMLGVDLSAGIAKSDAAPAKEDAKLNPFGGAGAIDLTAITPDEFSALLDRLRDSGALPAEGYKELRAVRLDLDKARVPSDRPVDVLELLKAKLAGPSAERTERQIQWLESITSQAGIDAIA
jgi:hypothetical protein